MPFKRAKNALKAPGMQRGSVQNKENFMAINKVIVIGNLGHDPELKHVSPNGTAVCSFSLAINEQWKDEQGNKQERTEWIIVEAWRKTAVLCAQYLSKGSQICVEGRLKTNTTDKDGQERRFTMVEARKIEFLDKKNVTPETKKHSKERILTVDDIPF